MKHLTSGSYNLQQIIATKDLTIKGDSDERSFIVFQGSCAPSMKLKEKNKEKFYSVRIVIEVYANGTFNKLMDSPYRYCECPNGCIWCAHSGSLVLLLQSIAMMPDHLSFNEMVNLFPEPLNETLSSPILVEFIFPTLDSEANKNKNQYKETKAKTHGSKRKNPSSEVETDSFETAEDEDIYNDINEMKAIDGVIDASTTPTYQLITKIDDWSKDILAGKCSNGSVRLSRVEFENHLKTHVKHKNSEQYIATQLVVLNRIEKLLEDFDSKCVLRPTLEKMKAKRNHMKTKLEGNGIKMDQIDLKKCVTYIDDEEETGEGGDTDHAAVPDTRFDPDSLDDILAGSLQLDILSTRMRNN